MAKGEERAVAEQSASNNGNFHLKTILSSGKSAVGGHVAVAEQHHVLTFKKRPFQNFPFLVNSIV